MEKYKSINSAATIVIYMIHWIVKFVYREVGAIFMRYEYDVFNNHIFAYKVQLIKNTLIETYLRLIK